MPVQKSKADEALALGLINAVYPSEELLPAAEKLAGKIARNAPISVRACKKAVNDGLRFPWTKHSSSKKSCSAAALRRRTRSTA